jgi:hypothetical protein
MGRAILRHPLYNGKSIFWEAAVFSGSKRLFKGVWDMSDRSFFLRGKLAYVLICLILAGLLPGCSPKLVPIMSSEDLQTCDDTAAAEKQSLLYNWSPDSTGGITYLVEPGKAEISTPDFGSILPLGPVTLKFKQPPADAGVSYRNMKVIVETITGSNPEWPVSSYTVVPTAQAELEVTWTPTKPGEYMLMVLFRNLETVSALGDNTALMAEQLELRAMGNHEEDFIIHYGPLSLAYVCVKIEATVNQNQPDEPVVLMPVENVTLQPSSTFTREPSPTFTSTPLPNILSTLTRLPYRPLATLTLLLPLPVVDCSVYPGLVTCNLAPGCVWDPQLPTGGGVCVNKP